MLALCLLSDTSEIGGREGGGGLVSLGIPRYNRPAELKGARVTFVPLAVIISAPVFMLIVRSGNFSFRKCVLWILSLIQYSSLTLSFLSDAQAVRGFLHGAAHNIDKRGFQNIDLFFSFCLESSRDPLRPFLTMERNTGACLHFCGFL